MMMSPWNTWQQNEHAKLVEDYKNVTLQVAYLNEIIKNLKRQKNIKDHLIRAKVPSDPKPHPSRRNRGMQKCRKNCTACPYIREVKSLKINQNEWKINQSLNCEVSNCIYLIECRKNNCNMKYVGETK